MNPAVDRTIAVDRLAFDDRAYILSSKDSPGGRGINAASVIHSFGGKTLAIIPAGGDRGARFEHYLEHCGFPVTTVPIRNDVRLNLTITDRHGLTIKLNEIGPRLDRGEIASVVGTVEAQLTNANWLMLCGSLPPGVPSDFYAQLIIRAQRKMSAFFSIPTAKRSRRVSKPTRPSSLPTSRKPSACSTRCC